MDRQLGEWNKRREAKEKEDRSQQRQKEAASLAISPTGGRRKPRNLQLQQLDTDLQEPEMPLSPTARKMLNVNDAYRNGEIGEEEKGRLKRHIIGQALKGGPELGANPMDEVMDADDDEDDDSDPLGGDDDDDDDDDAELGCEKVIFISLHSPLPNTALMVLLAACCLLLDRKHTNCHCTCAGRRG